MKSQISRHSHVAGKHYSGVYQQQGRMITDADWNELVELLKARLQQALQDVVGSSGAPRGSGLQLTPELKLRPGSLYVNGLRGQLQGDASSPMAMAEQPDFPLAPPLPTNENVWVYADLWERSVDGLADPELLDPGLHGADTTTRTRTMLQVKWCPATTDPTDARANPPQGNARFDLSLADGGTSSSSADEPPRIGNYLFRIEVHDVQSTAIDTMRLTLKWSSENGAEQQTLLSRDDTGAEQRNYLNLPPEFSTGAWAYEVFNAASEQHLGVHLASGFVPARGMLNPFVDAQNQPTHELQPGQTPPSVGTLPAQHIRRWDGHLSIDLRRAGPGQVWKPLAANALVSGWDKGQLLREVSGTPAQRGDIRFAAEGFSVRLENHLLTLLPAALDFVPGDHWLAQVREDALWSPLAAAPIDQRVQMLNGGAALGVHHHIAVIARVNRGVLQPDAAGSPAQRRLAFAPLTDIGAGGINWQPPACAAVDSVRSRLPSLANATAANATVDLALRALLCELDAANLPYDSNATDMKSVKDLLVRKTGDTMTGPLTVNGMLTINGLTLNTQPAQIGAVLVRKDAAGTAGWEALPLTAWDLTGGVLSVGQGVNSLLLNPPAGVFVKHRRNDGANSRTLEIGSDAVLSAGDGLPNGRIGFPGAGLNNGHGQLRWVPGSTTFEFICQSTQGAPSGDFGATPAAFAGLRAGTGAIESVLRVGSASGTTGTLTVNGAASVSHSKAGGGGSAGFEVGSLDSFAGSTLPNGRIGFPGVGLRHGQLRWVPASANFELIDATPLLPSGDYGATPAAGFVGLRAGRGEFESSLRIGAAALPGLLTLEGDARVNGSLSVYARQPANSLAIPATAPVLHVADNGNVGIGTANTSQARLLVDGDIFVTGRVIEKGQTMTLSKREFGPIDIDSSNDNGSLGGTSFRVQTAGIATLNLTVMSSPVQGVSAPPMSLLLYTPGGQTETIFDQVSLPANGVLMLEARHVLAPGLNALDLRCASLSGTNSVTVQTVSIIVTGPLADDIEDSLAGPLSL